jgi:hypothetical protein
MPNATGLFSRFRGRTAAAVNAPPPAAVVNAKNNVNTKVLSNALKNYVKSIRNLRNANPLGLSRNVLINSTATNRNKINRAIANYVMNVNKAKYLNNVARQAIPLAQTGAAPESVVAPVVNAAAQANTGVVQAAQQVAAQVNAHVTALKNIKNENVNTNAKLNSVVNRLKKNYTTEVWSGVSNRTGLTNKQKEILNALQNPFWSARQVSAPVAPLLAPPPANVNMYISKLSSNNKNTRNQARAQLKKYLNNPALNKNTRNKIVGLLAFNTLPSIIPTAAAPPPPPPPPPPKPTRQAPPPPPPPPARGSTNYSEIAASAAALRPYVTGNKTANNKNVFASSANSSNYYAKKNANSQNYYKVKKNGNMFNFNNKNAKVYEFVKGVGFRAKN